MKDLVNYAKELDICSVVNCLENCKKALCKNHLGCSMEVGLELVNWVVIAEIQK